MSDRTLRESAILMGFTNEEIDTFIEPLSKASTALNISPELILESTRNLRQLEPSRIANALERLTPKGND